ncbi:MAG: hypothetical protein AB2551_13840 [Candidatus Thiodiazotropha sp.]
MQNKKMIGLIASAIRLPSPGRRPSVLKDLPEEHEQPKHLGIATNETI